MPDEDENDTSIEVLHIDERQWSRYETRGSVPQLGNGSVMAAIGSHLYLFGGWNDNDFSSDIFIFDTELLTWEFVKTTENGPIPKYKAGMVVHNGKFVVFGGVGKPFNDQTGCNASYVSNKSFNFEFGHGWNNELHEFDPATSEYGNCVTTTFVSSMQYGCTVHALVLCVYFHQDTLIWHTLLSVYIHPLNLLPDLNVNILHMNS